MCNADAHCTLGREGGGSKKHKENFMCNFSCPILKYKFYFWDFPGGAVVKNLPANAGDTGSSPGPGRSHMPQGN